MKKKINYLTTFLLIITILFLNVVPVKAITYGRVSATNGLILRQGPGTSYTKVISLPYNATVVVEETNVQTNDESTGCSTGLWHKITYNSKTGYACSRYVEITGDKDDEEIVPPTSDMATMTDEEFNAYLDSQKFPESYKVKLIELHKKHPNWVFVSVKTRDNWNNLLKQENVNGRSLYQSTSSSTQGYLSTEDGFYNWYTDKFVAKDGSTWFQANSQTIEYYMDPRNFLNESGIFMFEDLNYYSSYQTDTAVKAILYTDFYNDLIPYYMEAATSYNVSPIYLAALSRQEVGLTSGYATSGTTKNYCSKDYTGYYNFYNIQATSGTKPVCNGLAYAVQKGWNTKQKAIVGGANWIVSGYIDAGQNTAYFQKWNTSINAKKEMYHQYMSNIRAVSSSAATTKNSYSSMSILDYPFVFQIPIYEGIPDETKLPPTGNPNNYLSSLKINNASVTNFDGAKTEYTVKVPSSTSTLTISATPVNTNAKITGIGTIDIKAETTTQQIVVTAQNGDIKTYTLTINRTPNESTDTEKPTPPDENNDKEDPEDPNNNGDDNKTEDKPIIPPIIEPTPQETIAKTSFKLIDNIYLKNLTYGSTVAGVIDKIQTVNEYAGINITNSKNQAKTSGSIVTGDKITITSNDMSSTYTIIIYGDVNGDGEITTLDLLLVQKHLLKKSTLNNAYFKAADVNKDNQVTTLDLLLIQKHILKKSNISQS